jgi:hypothetical protein
LIANGLFRVQWRIKSTSSRLVYGVTLAKGVHMRIRPLLVGAILILVSTSIVSAGPITGQPSTPQASTDPSTGASSPAGGATETSFTAGSLFDPTAGPLLRTAGVHYLELGTRTKLRHVGGVAGDSGGGGGGGYSSAGSGGGSSGGGAISIGNLTPELPLGSSVPALSFTPKQIPEPGALMLVLPGVALALRWRAQARRTR